MDALSETDGFAVCGHGGQRNDGVSASQQHDLCDAGLDGHSADFRRKAASENRVLCGGCIGFVADGQSGTCDGDARGKRKYQGDVIRSHTAAFPRAQLAPQVFTQEEQQALDTYIWRQGLELYDETLSDQVKLADPNGRIQKRPCRCGEAVAIHREEMPRNLSGCFSESDAPVSVSLSGLSGDAGVH